MSGTSITGPSEQSGPLNRAEEPPEALAPVTIGQSAPLPPTEPAAGVSAPPAVEDAASTGPSVSRGEWLDEREHWLTTGNHQIPRPLASRQTLPRPKRFRHVPRWVSAVVLAVVIVGAVITGILVVHAAGTVIPRHPAPPTVAPAHHTATPTHKATPAHR